MNEVLEYLDKIKTKYPSYRIGQAIVNAVGITCPEIFYMPDDVLLVRLKKLHDKELEE